MKEPKILRVQCADCGKVSEIPVDAAAARGEPIRCGKCGRLLVVRD